MITGEATLRWPPPGAASGTIARIREPGEATALRSRPEVREAVAGRGGRPLPTMCPCEGSSAGSSSGRWAPPASLPMRKVAVRSWQMRCPVTRWGTCRSPSTSRSGSPHRSTCAGVMVRLHRDQEAARILAINPGLPDEAGRWTSVGFKGGSEPGLLGMAWILESAAGATCPPEVAYPWGSGRSPQDRGPASPFLSRGQKSWIQILALF